MSIKIVTDSTCDLPQSILDELGITVVPLFINVGSTSYQDGIDITREAFYRQLPDFRPHPMTAAPGPDLFRQIYEGLAAEGASEILSIHISISLSASVDVARVAAKETQAVPVTVLDSQQLSLGAGFMVEAAARAAAEGQSMSEILAMLEELGPRIHVIAALDTLEFLRRGGRMNAAVAGLGSLLQIKPILKMNLGQPTSERVRTTNGAGKRMASLLSDLAPLERVALVHTHSAEKAEALRQKIAHLLPSGELLSVDITPVIGAHLGPGAAGFAAITAR